MLQYCYEVCKMYKQLSSTTLLITIITMLLLTSCSTPALAPTPTPTVTIEPTPVVTATPVPTATPRTEPYSVEQAKEIIEDIVGINVTFVEDLQGTESYEFTAGNANYYFNKLYGYIQHYINPPIDNGVSGTDIDERQAHNIAVKKAYEFCPKFFDLNFTIETESIPESNTFMIYMYQISPISRRTGNFARARVSKGKIEMLNIYNSEDPTICDRDYKISEEEATELAYKYCKENIKYLKPRNPSIDVYINTRDDHKVKATLTVHDGKQQWSLEFTTKNNMHRTGFVVTIDANTGEIIEFDELL